MNTLYARINAIGNPTYNPFVSRRNNDNIDDAEIIEEEFDYYASAIQGITENHLREIAEYIMDNIDEGDTYDYAKDCSHSRSELEWEYEPLGLTIHAERKRDDRRYVDEWSQGVPRYEVECERDVITVNKVTVNATMESYDAIAKKINSILDRWNTYRSDEDREVWQSRNM